MGSSRVGSNPTRSGNSYSRWPDRTTQLPQGPTPAPQPKLGNVGMVVKTVYAAQHHGALSFLVVCCCSCGKAMTGNSSNKYHLCHQQVQLEVSPNQHQPNRQPCRTRFWATTRLMQTACLGPDEVCLAGPLELQPSAVAGAKTCQNGLCPNPLQGTASAEQGNR